MTEVAEKQWYIIHTYSGFEAKVKDSLRRRADDMGMAETIEEILVPTEEVVEIRDGKKKSQDAQILSRVRSGQDGNVR